MKTFLKKLMVLMLIAILSISTFACTEESTSESESVATPDVAVTISAELDKDEITVGETANLTVTVTGSADTSYALSYSENGIISVTSGVVSIVAENLSIAKYITITATANANKSKIAMVSIIVRPLPVEGRVGELTSDMLTALGNPSITVKGVLTDNYTDVNQPMYSGSTAYEMEVYMQDGKWSGTWNRKIDVLGASPVKITDVYARSADDGYVDANGNLGHALERVFINKNNQVERKIEKNYMSVPAVWEAQHLYNHLGQLTINKFEYDPVNNVYEYVWNRSNSDDEMLMTYLAFSLTPLMTETLDKVYLVVENGAVTKLLAQTAPAYLGEYYDQNQVHHYDSMTQSIVELTFSNVGTTVVADPAPYTAPQHVELLTSAINEMKSATNYTFHAKETTTSAPSGDAGDYEVMAVGDRPANNVSASGTVGVYGKVTKDVILLADTMKYSYSMDGKDYCTEYYGYKNNGDGSYDHFEYDSANQGFIGTKRVNGDVTDVLPTFDFNPNIFKFKSSYTGENGVTYYVFALRETSINREVALEVSMHDYADDAKADGSQEFTITVTGDGHLYQTSYPYDLVMGTYLGNITTTYGFVGTTVVEEAYFDNYVQREIMDDWSDFHVKYYYDKPVGGANQDITADVALSIIFGEDAKDVPPVTVFTDIFGDNLYGPFFDWIEVGTNPDGTPIYHAKFNLNTSATEYDENSMITNRDEIFAKLQTALAKYGFAKSEANSGKYGSTYICFIKNNVQIYVENNDTKNMWIYFCVTGDWTLKKA